MNERLKKIGIELSPIHKVVISFMTLILAGALLLILPVSSTGGVSFVDALFTSTSAVCVTGLTVLDTAKDFTFFGQLVIIMLIQFGGLGIMTFSISIIALLGGNYSIKWRITLESFYNEIKILSMKSILKRIIMYTFSIELGIAGILFTQFYGKFDFKTAVWHSIFHSVSSFCNAGFSTFSDNIVGYYDNSIVILALSASIIMGGLGFFVLSELFNYRHIKKKKTAVRLSLHTRIVLITTIALLFLGTAGFLVLEWNFVVKDFSLKAKILTAFFHSTSCRTAGFNSIDVGALRESTLLMMTALMFIGGSPGSIAGGIKTTTLTVLLGMLVTKFSGKRQVLFWNRALDPDTTEKAATLFILSGIFVYFSTFFLLAIDAFDLGTGLSSALFEVTSAFGTVGLSTGITPKLLTEGKLLIVLVMFIGRLGPLSLITALTINKKEVPIEYSEEHVMIG
ncbi:MAG: Trk family potassium uptake protein [Spirochaetes bacterium]|jgi:trk system potassium uptake protein TrkH|nr:Trk family potassium uptake protein [Spirochaetota bacterium]